jgi:hypothetical protein
MGAAIFDRAGRPAWALSLTGIEPRFRPERQEYLGHLLVEEAARISRELQGSGTPGIGLPTHPVIQDPSDATLR